ncbi:MAG TPA: toll/interleukin-1 receptor domain-containing protein [Hyphomicrobiaceae bacterium]|jgi:tetratricopeptide (TPR) repeat protein|nr:toll/interleukin-1 receptor domain-containing protein [Hyphomicrobiaceae bacterium]
MTDNFRVKPYDVIVSYQRTDDDQRQELVETLETLGYDVLWDGKLGPGYWREEWRNHLHRSKLMIVLWSVAAAQSDEVKDEAGGAKALGKCLSVPLDGEGHVPAPYLETNRHHWDRNARPATRQAQLEKILDKVAQIAGPPPRSPVPQHIATIPVDLGDIRGAPDKLVGRKTELDMLRDAWASRPPRKVNAVVLHAIGGAGKSSLLRVFANELLAAGGDGATRIYGWSADSQGTGEQKNVDADGFVLKALADLGYRGKPPSDPVERSRALARLIQRERVLLLLDGLEPLQDPPGLNKGRFKDRSLAELIKVLASQNPGLVVLTTRQTVPELAGHGPLVVNHALDKLPDRDGAELLVELGVHGRQRELEAAVREVDGHALSVTLLGTYLADVCGGDINRRDRFNFADIVQSPAEQSESLADDTIVHAERSAKVMRGYLEQFGKLAREDKTAGLGGPERALLNLLGLFDRPADGGAVEALIKRRVRGLTDNLFETCVEKRIAGFKYASVRKKLTPNEQSARLREAKNRLRKLRLLSKADPKDAHELDAHPLVRAFFAGHLEKTAPKAARAAHEILYHHYSAAGPDLPKTLEEMRPLFHAVQHGVKAGRVQEVFDEVFKTRIRQDDSNYLVSELGAYGSHLATCSHFYQTPWHTPRPELTPSDQAWLLNSTAFALTANGRPRDSLVPRRAGLAADIAAGDWPKAVMDGAGLTVTLVVLGQISDAVGVTRLAVEQADGSGDDGQREYARANLAATLVMAGQFDRASDLFSESEVIRGKVWPDEAQQYSVQGYIYGELLLARGDPDKALSRGQYMIRSNERHISRNGSRIGAVADLAFGRLLVAVAQDRLNRPEAADTFYGAVEDMRRAKFDALLPLALLARAAHRRRRAAAGEVVLIDGIRADLAAVEDIAGEEMQFYLADLALERARFALDVPSAFGAMQDARVEASAQTAKAAELIAAIGYHRRDSELVDLRTRLAAA